MITTNPADVSNKSFDFVVVGGGTAGLALAARLSEDSSVNVAVIEAGEREFDDPKISVPAQFGATIGDSKYDWGFSTSKQKYSNDKEFLWSRGKGLGGSSNMNFYAWIKPPAFDMDSFEKLGNPGWNWEEFSRYSKKSERFHIPDKEVTDLFPHTYNTAGRGTSGPIQTTIPPHVHTIDTLIQKTLWNLGIKKLEDSYEGDINGPWIASSNLDPKTWSRSDSATAYLLPAQGRSNLTVLTNALVSRVLFADSNADGEDLTATGVEFIHGGHSYTVNAHKEVILSAGSIKDPQILEISGIGRRDVLSRIGVETRVDLPGVGENLQDHPFFGISYELNPVSKHRTLDLLRDPEIAKEELALYAEGKGLFRTGLTSFTYLSLKQVATPGAAELAEKIEKDIEHYKNSTTTPGLREQLDVQLAALHSDASPEFEIVMFPGLFSVAKAPEPGKTYVSFLCLLNHPLSRGTIHSKTSNPEDAPEIDPRYLEKDSDLELLVEELKYSRLIAKTEPFKSEIVGTEVEPGPQCTSDEDIRNYIKNTASTAWHAIGTCSMLPRDKQGVVDPHLKVYGTKNLRVVDISIIPVHIAAHTQSAAYTIAEKAADLIRSKYQPVGCEQTAN